MCLDLCRFVAENVRKVSFEKRKNSSSVVAVVRCQFCGVCQFDVSRVPDVRIHDYSLDCPLPVRR